eukprot:SAG31_NODE_25170_length_466_cov_1.414169_1_plen_27_part_10
MAPKNQHGESAFDLGLTALLAKQAADA